MPPTRTVAHGVKKGVWSRAVGETNVTDGRLLRASRTRDNVVDALLELIDGGNLRPTAREIAAQAGVSLRSLYVHFDDVEALFFAAAVRHEERGAKLLPEPLTTGTVEERIAAFVRRRALIYERGRNIRRAAVLQEPFSAAIRTILEEARRIGRREVECVFAPELDGLDHDRRRRALAATDVASYAGGWDVLREQHGLDVDEAVAAMCDLVRAAVAPASVPAPAADT
jgi:TetR/AcrR family transcriptional regulator, regulator of autoinduction and epiphytic fitness